MIGLLAIVALVVGIWGVVTLFSGNIAFGIILIVIACAIGPGGWAIYK